MQYPKTVKAAKAVSADEKAMAAAIFDEIPPRGQGRTPAGSPTIETALMDLSTELRSSGLEYSAATLKEYREVAAWAAKGNTPPQGVISWLPVSWSVHREAYQGGMTWKTFVRHVEAKEIKVVDDLRRLLNKRPTRPNRPTEKIKEVKDLIASGQLAPDDLNDLASALPEPALDAARRQRARNKMRDVADAQHDNDSEEEIEQFNNQMDSLQKGVNSLTDLVNDMAAPFTPTPGLKLLADADSALGAAQVYYHRNGFLSDEADAVNTRLEIISQRLDMLRLAHNGGVTDADIEAFLSQAG